MRQDGIPSYPYSLIDRWCALVEADGTVVIAGTKNQDKIAANYTKDRWHAHGATKEEAIKRAQEVARYMRECHG